MGGSGSQIKDCSLTGCAGVVQGFLKRPFLRVGQLAFLRHRSLITSTLDSERNVHCETGRPLKYEKLGTNAENTPTATLITR